MDQLDMDVDGQVRFGTIPALVERLFGMFVFATLGG